MMPPLDWSRLEAVWWRKAVRLDILAGALGVSVEEVMESARENQCCCFLYDFQKKVSHVAYNPDGAGFRPNAPRYSTDEEGPPLAAQLGTKRKRTKPEYIFAEPKARPKAQTTSKKPEKTRDTTTSQTTSKKAHIDDHLQENQTTTTKKEQVLNERTPLRDSNFAKTDLNRALDGAVGNKASAQEKNMSRNASSTKQEKRHFDDDKENNDAHRASAKKQEKNIISKKPAPTKEQQAPTDLIRLWSRDMTSLLSSFKKQQP